MQRYLFCLTLLGLFLFAACAGRAPQNDQAATTGDDKTTTSAVTTTPGKSLPKIVAFGDSLTAGLGLSTAESYPSVLQEKLRADGYQYEVVNAGVSGDTSAGGVRRVDWSLEGDVRMVIIELGANDLLRGQPVAEMKKNLGAIIERAESRNAKVLLAGMYSLTSLGSDYQREVHEAFQ
jgi:acyl-CoA thioesterase-1